MNTGTPNFTASTIVDEMLKKANILELDDALVAAIQSNSQLLPLGDFLTGKGLDKTFTKIEAMVEANNAFTVLRELRAQVTRRLKGEPEPVLPDSSRPIHDETWSKHVTSGGPETGNVPAKS